MLRIKQTDQFDKDVRRLKQQGEDLSHLFDIVRLLALKEDLDSAYRVHTLHGEWEGVMDCHVGPDEDWLLLYRIDGPDLVLIRTGSHSDVFRSFKKKSS